MAQFLSGEWLSFQTVRPIIQLLKDGETSSVIIANKARCNVAYVNAVKNELLQEWIRTQRE